MEGNGPGCNTLFIRDFNQEEISKLQKIENAVHWVILQLPTYTANSLLRGDVGESSVRARDKKIKLLFAKHLLKENIINLASNIFQREYEIGDKMDETAKEVHE